MKILSDKTNKSNVTDLFNQISGKLNITGVEVTSKTVKFYANEKNGNLSQLAVEILEWSKQNGFEMKSRPVGQSKVNNEFYEGKTQDVIWQWTSYTLK